MRVCSCTSPPQGRAHSRVCSEVLGMSFLVWTLGFLSVQCRFELDSGALTFCKGLEQMDSEPDGSQF